MKRIQEIAIGTLLFLLIFVIAWIFGLGIRDLILQKKTPRYEIAIPDLAPPSGPPFVEAPLGSPPRSQY